MHTLPQKKDKYFLDLLFEYVCTSMSAKAVHHMSEEDDDEDFALFSLEPIFPGASFLAACGEEEEAILFAIFQCNFFRHALVPI